MSSDIDIPWIVTSDFIEVRNQSEKLGGNPIKLNRCNAFNSCIAECGLIDLGSSSLKYTWTNKSKRRPIQEKLDRALVNGKWLQEWPQSHVVNLLRHSSDHSPVLMRCFHLPRTITPMARNFSY